MLRRYFIMDVLQAQAEDVTEALEMCIGLTTTQRYSLDGSKLFIKTTQKDIDAMLEKWGGSYTWEQIISLTFTTEYTLEEVKTILRGVDWTNEDAI
jgi:hypothetical protein